MQIRRKEGAARVLRDLFASTHAQGSAAAWGCSPAAAAHYTAAAKAQVDKETKRRAELVAEAQKVVDQ